MGVEASTWAFAGGAAAAPALAGGAVAEPDGLPDDLGRAISELASVVLGECTVDSVFELVAALARDSVPATSAASVTVRLDGQRLATRSASGQHARDLDQVQYRLGEGPCVATVTVGHPHNVHAVGTGDASAAVVVIARGR